MSQSILQPEKRVLPTLERDGSRRWLTPRLAVGRFFRRRRALAYGLIALLTVLPLVTINGKPAVLLNVVDRQFTLFGYTFLPTDTVLLALLMVAWFATIFLTTAALGRAWCGWACPQTVYLEFVFRPIERLCLGRAGVGGKPKQGISPLRYVAMYALFLLMSLVVTHTLLSYFVGAAQLRQWMTGSPADHPAAFALIVGSTAGVLFNFAIFREQMCSIACPYGRFQSVLIDRHSIGVRYDAARGEPRGKSARRGGALAQIEAPRRDACVSDGTCTKCGKVCPGTGEPVDARAEARAVALAGLEPSPTAARSADCVDCTMCVQVCPAGIDIRDGAQLECIHCAQCVDACDAVMTKLGRPTGLIGYHSLASLEGKRTRVVRPRVILYACISVAFLAAMLGLILTKQPFDAALVRNAGLPFVVMPQGQVQNTMRLTLRNRTGQPQTYTLASKTPGVTLAESAAPAITVPANGSAVLPLHLLAEPATFAAGDGKRAAEIVITDETHAGRTVTCELFGPGGAP